MRHQERGMSMWPFVISLVLLLCFLFLWYDQKGEADKLKTENANLQKQISNADAAAPGLLQQVSAREDLLTEITKHVGYATKSLAGSTLQWSDPAALAKALNPEADGSPLKDLKAASTVATKRDMFKAKAGAAAPTTVDLAQLPKEFKDKVAEVRGAYPGQLPAMPDDPDDAAAMAKYKADLETYQKQFESYNAKLSELTKMADWPKYSAVLGVGPMYDPDKVGEIVNWTFWDKPPTAEVTVEEFLKYPALIVNYMKTSFMERVNAQVADLAAAAKTNEELKKGNEDLKTQFETEQAAHTADVGKFQKEAADNRAVAEAKTVEATTAAQALAKAKEDAKVDAAKADQAIKARDNRIRTDKEIRDLAIQRDEPDGTLLSADNNLGTCYLNLGRADKVYAGVKFAVSYMGRGGIRMPKGSVLVTKVLDEHYSQARILDVVPGEPPMGAGDIISNPFFDAKRTIHVYVPADLKKYPKSIADARLKALGCVIDDGINDKTDFVVLPSGTTVSPSPAAAPAEGAAPAAGAESEFDKLSRLARDFGATLVTERMLEEYLGY